MFSPPLLECKVIKKGAQKQSCHAAHDQRLLSSISFPESTCLLVSAKPRNSRIINFQTPRFSVSRRMRALAYNIASTVSVPQKHPIRTGKARRVEFGFERTGGKPIMERKFYIFETFGKPREVVLLF